MLNNLLETVKKNWIICLIAVVAILAIVYFVIVPFFKKKSQKETFSDDGNQNNVNYENVNALPEDQQYYENNQDNDYQDYDENEANGYDMNEGDVVDDDGNDDDGNDDDQVDAVENDQGLSNY